MNLETVLYDVRDGVATITLNRPDAMNAWTPQLSDELSLAMGAADADDDVRAVVLTGAGKALLFKTIDYARSLAASCVYLQVNKQNNAQQFYSKHGFTIREASILEIGGGYIMDDYIMELKLNH